MAGPIRVGMIGCGGNACGHANRLIQMEETEIVALADPSEASIARMQERNPATAELPVYADFREMLTSESLAAVEISTPHTLHFQQIMASLEAGCHVLCEKPMVCSVEHAHQVIDKVDQTGRVFLLSYQRHFQPIYPYLKARIEEGLLGEIQFVSGAQGQNWLRNQQGKWRLTKALSGGGQLNDSGSHLLDILLWMSGLTADVVTAEIENFGEEVDINSAISLRFTNGAVGTITIVGNSPGGMWEDIMICGSKAIAFIRQGKLTLVPESTGQPVEPDDLPEPSTPERNFVDAVLGKDTVKSPPVCGLRVIELTEAAWESAETGRPVHVKHT